MECFADSSSARQLELRIYNAALELACEEEAELSTPALISENLKAYEIESDPKDVAKYLLGEGLIRAQPENRDVGESTELKKEKVGRKVCRPCHWLKKVFTKTAAPNT